MATTANRHSNYVVTPKTLTQKVCIALGLFFIMVGLIGVVMPGFLGMHLSLVHNLIHLGSGSLALWSGYSDDTKKSYVYCLSFGVLFSVLGVFGFVFGSPGYPSVGNLEADDYLLRIIPNAFEIGTSDHLLYFILGATLLLASAVFGNRVISGKHGNTKRS